MIYLDNAATTKPAKEVIDAMLPYLTDCFGNASSRYDLGARSREAVGNARRQIARVMKVNRDEIFFTSGGSESDNWALRSVFDCYKTKGNHIITSKIEHHAILNTCEYLEKECGARITYLNVDSEGFVDLEQLLSSISPETILISVMAANNEIGTIQSLARIGEIARSRGILFHTDAVQAFGHIPMDVNEMNIDLLSASGHKFNAVKGTGFLYVRSGVEMSPLIHGGSQEFGLRAGTENVPGIVGMGVAAERAFSNMESNVEKEIELRDFMIYHLLQIPNIRLNGTLHNRLPNNVNVSFDCVDAESLVMFLGMEGICASQGSACTSGDYSPSHVLKAIGLPDDMANGSIRLTLSAENTLEEITFVIDRIKKNVNYLREIR